MFRARLPVSNILINRLPRILIALPRIKVPPLAIIRGNTVSTRASKDVKSNLKGHVKRQDTIVIFYYINS